jgi:ABC-type polysaccharide/polyol phosphate export permease
MMNANNNKNDLIDALGQFSLWSYLARQDIKIRYRRSKIGPFWITVSMAVFCVALGIVYSQLFKMEVSELLPFLTVGMVVWGFVASCIGEMPNLFVDNASYMKDMRVNPLTILMRALIRNIIIFGHNLLILVGVYLYFNIWPGWIGLLAMVGFLLVTLNLAVIGITLSIIGARFRDISQITQSFLQVMFFITPIFWFPRLLPADHWIVIFNPFAYFLDLIRSPLLGRNPEVISWVAALVMLLALSFLAMLAYRKNSARIVFWV